VTVGVGGGNEIIAVNGILMVDVDVVDVVEGVVFGVVGVVGFGEEDVSDVVLDSRYQVNTSLQPGCRSLTGSGCS